MNFLNRWFGDGADYELYFINDLPREITSPGVERIKAARKGYDGPQDKALRTDYEREMMTTLPEVRFDPKLFAKVAKAGSAALDNLDLSPCAYFHGDQTEKQGIPREAIKHPVRTYTTDARAAVPDAPALFAQPIVDAIRKRVGSNFSLINVMVSRNYHVDPDTNSKYDLLSDRWHFDHKQADIFYLFCALSHVERRDGPTHCLSASDSRKLLGMGFDCDLRAKDPNGGIAAQVIEALPSLARCEGQPGTMLMSHTNVCLHKAGPPPAPGRVRDIILFSLKHTAQMDVSWVPTGQ